MTSEESKGHRALVARCYDCGCDRPDIECAAKKATRWMSKQCRDEQDHIFRIGKCLDGFPRRILQAFPCGIDVLCICGVHYKAPAIVPEGGCIVVSRRRDAGHNEGVERSEHGHIVGPGLCRRPSHTPFVDITPRSMLAKGRAWKDAAHRDGRTLDVGRVGASRVRVRQGRRRRRN